MNQANAASSAAKNTHRAYAARARPSGTSSVGEHVRTVVRMRVRVRAPAIDPPDIISNRTSSLAECSAAHHQCSPGVPCQFCTKMPLLGCRLRQHITGRLSRVLSCRNDYRKIVGFSCVRTLSHTHTNSVRNSVQFSSQRRTHTHVHAS